MTGRTRLQVLGKLLFALVVIWLLLALRFGL